MKSNRIIVLLGMIFLVMISSAMTLLFSGLGNLILTGSILGYSVEDMSFMKKIIGSKRVLEEKFYEEISEEELFDGAMKGMFSAVNDPYTEYLPKEENEALEQVTSGEYVGVGIVVSKITQEKYPEIISVLEDSPAKEAKLEIGDKIVTVNEETTENKELDDVVEKIKLKEGSKINLGIEREGENINVILETKEINLPTVASEKIDDIGYIQIGSFGEDTAKEFKEQYSKLREENIKGLIIDVRDNGGGVYESVVEIAKTIIPKGLIVYTENKDGVKKEERSNGEGIDIPLVLLVNENSASASEILAGAVKDRGVGTLVGNNTFGKGVVQGWFIMGDGTSIKLTIGKYFTPNGVCIDGKGIAPDIEVKSTGYIKDAQLNKALEILKK